MPTDRAAGAARTTPLAPGLLARVSGALAALRGDAAWFGPGAPLPAVAPPDDAAGARGRAFDYPVAYNLGSRTREGDAVTFDQLRRLADAHDLTRLCIETRKDQVEALDFTIARVDDADGDPPQAVADFFRRPDRRRGWGAWVRMLLEDLLVLDAPAVYLRRTQGGAFYSAEAVDGSTIRPLLDATGREPEPPDDAYVQLLKGMVAARYRADELLYRPRNLRTHRVYGYSPVEQILLTVNLALRRQAHQLAYYTEGTVPEALGAVPEGWTPDQIRQFQDYWDYLIEGPEALMKRRKLKFVPGGMQVERIQTAPLFDDADEWLARVVCYAFSLPPSAFSKQVNRATAQTAQEAAQEEGLAPLMRWVKALADEILQGDGGFGLREWEFRWATPDEVDQLAQAQIDQIYVTIGAKTPKQVAEERGWEFDQAAADAQQAREDAQAAARTAAVGVGAAAPDAAADDAPRPKDEAAKAAGRSLRRIY